VRLLDWLAELPPRQALMVPMALDGRARNQVLDWDRHVLALIQTCKINSIAKMELLLTEMSKQGKIKSMPLNPLAAESEIGPAILPSESQRKYSRRVEEMCPLMLTEPQL
jgi:hypothetical protein